MRKERFSIAERQGNGIRCGEISSAVSVCLVVLVSALLVPFALGGERVWADTLQPSGEVQSELSQGFDGYGHIDRIGKTEIVIDDKLMRLSGSIAYREESGGSSNASRFLVGTRVAYQLGRRGEIVRLWHFSGQLP